MAPLKEDFVSAHEDAESKPFLDVESETLHPPSTKRDGSPLVYAIRSLKSVILTRFAMLHGGLFIIYACLFFALIFYRWEGESVCRPIIFSPAHGAVEYETRPVDGLAEGSIYAGYPTPESDAAWAKLVEGINIKIFPEEMSQLGATSLKMQDGSGYLAALGVYHELHCIKRLRKWFYADYYYPNQTDLEWNERMTHAEHCLEFIRQSAMCHGDITVTSFRWLHDSAGRIVEPTTKEGALHQCVNWDRLSNWAQSRRVDLYDRNLLVPEEQERE